MSPNEHVSSGDTALLRPIPLHPEQGGVPHVVITHAADPQRSFALRQSLTIGRGEHNDICVDDPGLSRVHAALVPRADGIEINDLGSRNGTFVDGRPTRQAMLRSGVVRLGECVLALRRLTEDWCPAKGRGPLVGGVSFSQIRRAIDLVGPTDLMVMIRGETGTGKEVAARLLHEHSGTQGPFIAVNCAALPESLAESELFGHQRGAFTGADRARRGLFSLASGGTLLLDEIGELPLALQAKLLRVLEDGVVRPVGSESAQQVKVRVVAATNRDLAEEVTANRFRLDLQARLSAVELMLPPLRSHPEDLLPLSRYLLRRVGRPDVELSADALEALSVYPWPQNVRELDSALRAAVLVAPRIELDQLPERISSILVQRRRATPAVVSRSGSPKGGYGTDDTRQRLERSLRDNRGNVRQVSHELGYARGYVYRLMKKWDLNPATFRT